MADLTANGARAAHETWLLAQLRPNSLNLALRNLERQGFRTFVPYEMVEGQRRRMRVLEMQPLFPGYVFVQLDMATMPWRPINYTIGVSRLVCFSPNVPAEVPRDLMDALKARCAADGTLLPPAGLAPGDRVRINKGPFADYVATIEQLLPNQRLWVLLDILGKKTRITAKLTDLGHLPPAKL